MAKTTTEGRLDMRHKTGTPHNQIGYELIWIIEGKAYPIEPSEHPCPFCKLETVVELPPPLKAIQTDGTTHVCHPALGGCNWGFEKETK